jgi:hypothetical protein
MGLELVENHQRPVDRNQAQPAAAARHVEIINFFRHLHFGKQVAFRKGRRQRK